MTREEKIEGYKTMCYEYGLTAILVILRQCDGAESYDECQIILDAINASTPIKSLEISFPAKYDMMAASYTTLLLRLITGRDGIEVFNYLEKHIQIIKDYVK